MTDIAVDTSALVAVLLLEDGKELIARCLSESDRKFISSATLHELSCVFRRFENNDQSMNLWPLVEHLDLIQVAFDEDQSGVARAGYQEFGRGSGHKAKLNMGDCFSYALAKTHSLPLLFKGDDFIHTDILSALSPTIVGESA